MRSHSFQMRLALVPGIQDVNPPNALISLTLSSITFSKLDGPKVATLRATF